MRVQMSHSFRKQHDLTLSLASCGRGIVVSAGVDDLRHEWEGFMPASGPKAVTSLLRFPRRKGAPSRDTLSKRGGATDPGPGTETAR